MRMFLMVALLLLALPAAVPAQAKLQAELKKRADQFRGPASTNYASAVAKYNSAVDKAVDLYDEIDDINRRYLVVKPNVGALDKLLFENFLSSAKKLYAAQKKLLAEPGGAFPNGGTVYQDKVAAKKCFDAGELAYQNQQWAAAATEYGSCTSNAKAASAVLDNSLKALGDSLKTAASADILLKKYEQ